MFIPTVFRLDWTRGCQRLSASSEPNEENWPEVKTPSPGNRRFQNHQNQEGNIILAASEPNEETRPEAKTRNMGHRRFKKIRRRFCAFTAQGFVAHQISRCSDSIRSYRFDTVDGQYESPLIEPFDGINRVDKKFTCLSSVKIRILIHKLLPFSLGPRGLRELRRLGRIH